MTEPLAPPAEHGRETLTGLSGLFGFTPAEARLAQSLMQGGGLRDAGMEAVEVGKLHESSDNILSLIEALISFQFEVLTTHLNDGGKLPH